MDSIRRNDHNGQCDRRDQQQRSSHAPGGARNGSKITAKQCTRCGKESHPRNLCPANVAVCHKCGKKGHYSSQCRSKRLDESGLETAFLDETTYQFGFLQNRSTLQQLLIFFNLLTNQANNKSSVDVIYLDFKKAFDSVSHVKLLEKLWAFGITDNVWHWIHAYLTNRVKCISIHGAVSDLLPVTSGVPQGNILGHSYSLFLLLIYPPMSHHPEFCCLLMM